jgi:L-threonylcarbamoyladenylate synthase
VALILPRTGIDEAAGGIRAGQVVAIPTDTVYGFAADPFQPAAVERLYRLKGRPENKPILLLVDSRLQAEALAADLPPAFARLAALFWPGPLTLILPASPSLSRRLTAGGDTIAVRFPGSPLTQRLIRATRVPLTGTSANRSGFPPARSAREVHEQFPFSDLTVLDGGPSPRDLPSTIVDLTGEPRIVREGAVPAQAILCSIA